jgi:hypothetical protein
MLKRRRVGDPRTLIEFIRLEDREFRTEESGQQLVKTSEMSDVIFVNNSDDMATLEIAFEKLLKDIYFR